MTTTNTQPTTAYRIVLPFRTRFASEADLLLDSIKNFLSDDATLERGTLDEIELGDVALVNVDVETERRALAKLDRMSLHDFVHVARDLANGDDALQSQLQRALVDLFAKRITWQEAVTRCPKLMWLGA
jgi:hypothetical protein